MVRLEVKRRKRSVELVACALSHALFYTKKLCPGKILPRVTDHNALISERVMHCDINSNVEKD